MPPRPRRVRQERANSITETFMAGTYTKITERGSGQYQRFVEHSRLRRQGLSARTQQAYARAVRQLAEYVQKSRDQKLEMRQHIAKAVKDKKKEWKKGPPKGMMAAEDEKVTAEIKRITKDGSINTWQFRQIE